MNKLKLGLEALVISGLIAAGPISGYAQEKAQEQKKVQGQYQVQKEEQKRVQENYQAKDQNQVREQERNRLRLFIDENGDGINDRFNLGNKYRNEKRSENRAGEQKGKLNRNEFRYEFRLDKQSMRSMHQNQNRFQYQFNLAPGAAYRKGK
ncbi:hypothetical protein JXB28_06440 [Candidatus Woesearchaeota archaeon]|nr:hypothetical protein [Candidatus Woesearchaeota archaeon]